MKPTKAGHQSCAEKNGRGMGEKIIVFETCPVGNLHVGGVTLGPVCGLVFHMLAGK